MFLFYLKRGVAIIKRNLLVDESLAPAKLYSRLFVTDRLKINMNRACQDYTFTQATRAREPHNLRLRAGDCIRLAYERKLCEHVVENNFFVGRNTIRKKSILLVNFFVWKTVLWEKTFL